MIRKLLTGKIFGSLTVIGDPIVMPVKRGTRIKYECRCACGGTTIAEAENLKSGHTKSCGCLKAQKGITSEPEYWVFSGMKYRCGPTSQSYPRYGGRGIKVCDRWVNGGYSVFISDMGKRPSPAHSIERIDNNGNYEPSNCKWATGSEQLSNTRRSRRVNYKGVVYSTNELCGRFNVVPNTLRGWMDRGVIEKKLDFLFGREAALKTT